ENSNHPHYSTLKEDELPINLQQYEDQYVLRISDWSCNSVRDQVMLSAKELDISIWEVANTHKFMDLQVSESEGIALLSMLKDKKVSDEDFKMEMMIDDLPQRIFETYPFNTASEDGDIKSNAEIFFRQYRDINVIYNWFDLLVETYPHLLTVEWIGQTYEGRDIKALRLTAHQENSKGIKTIAITGGIHAREWVSVSTACYVLYQFLLDYEAGDPKAIFYLKNMDFLFLPVMNPDGYSETWGTNRLWRKNKQETYNPRCQGIDIDHNFNFHFTRSMDSPCGENYPGEGAFESLESYAWDKYLNETKHDHPIHGYLDLHSYAEEVLYPYAFTCGELPRDEENLLELAYGLSQSIRLTSGKNYGVLSACEDKNSDLMPSMGAGSALDYMYHNKAYWAFVLKLRDSGSHGFLLPSKFIVPVGNE
ncbi:hypothetical protein CANARDRAFT_180869, partial [[Candida] arabinofermentans NRRL YB-2248]